MTPEEIVFLNTGVKNWRVSNESIERHDTALIDNINNSVSTSDHLYILGDVVWGGYKEANRFLGRIRCKNVHLIWGNHDKPEIGPLFKTVREQGIVNYNKQKIFVNHYSMRVWEGSHRGVWQLYGHSHNTLPPMEGSLSLDVGVDGHDYMPWSFDDIARYMAPRMEKFLERRMPSIKQDSV